eukprot:8529279-Pyramimonas_sp.AAC.1
MPCQSALDGHASDLGNRSGSKNPVWGYCAPVIILHTGFPGVGFSPAPGVQLAPPVIEDGRLDGLQKDAKFTCDDCSK